MADQCIVCLENLDSAEPSQQLQGSHGGDADLGASPSASTSASTGTFAASTSAQHNHNHNPLPLAVASPTASSAATAATTDFNSKNDPRLDHDDNVAVIQVCGHMLHDICLKAWSGKANSCPICRQAFHLVDVYDKIGGTLLTSYKVEDKKQVVEFDPLAWLDENPEEEVEATPCPVCQTCDHEDVLLLCDGCDTPYHTYCIGLEDIPEGSWYCMECVDRFPALPQQIRAAARGRGRGRRSGYFPRTQASMRNERTRARTDRWLGAWGEFSNHVLGVSGIDLDSNDDGDDGLGEYHRSQQRRDGERREWQRQRWQQRLTIASRAGARDVFARNIQGVVERQVVPTPQQATPVVQETPEERQAWRAFERARASTPSGRKRKSRSITASPVEPAPEPERPLKRPRTRRIPVQADGGSSRASASSSHPHNERNGRPATANSPPPDEGPSFLNTLLKEVEQSAPSDDETVRSVFGLPQPVDPSSPVASPTASAHNSPRAMSLTPPPPPPPVINGAARSASRSPVLSLSSHIEPVYPPANYSPTRSNGEASDSESRARRRREASPELRQPRPRRQIAVRLSRSQDASPTRKELPLEVKENISQVVRAALKPHWKSSQLSSDQYASINRNVSHKIYDEVADPSAVDDETKRHWQSIATEEVARAVAELKT